jgi:hypothetical protein
MWDDRVAVPAVRVAAVAILGVFVAASSAWAAPVTERVSVASDGREGHHGSAVAAISPDGRYVLFNSLARFDERNSHLCSNAYLRDRALGTTSLVSVTSDDRAAACGHGVSMTPDARFVVFTSSGRQVVPGPDRNGRNDDVFVRDREEATTTRVSVSPRGAQFCSWSGITNSGVNYQAQISEDGRYVAFSAQRCGDDFPYYRAYRRDLVRGVTTRLARRERNALPAGMSPDGRYVAVFTGGSFDSMRRLVVRDAARSRIIRVSVPGFVASERRPFYGTAYLTRGAARVAFTAGWRAYVFDRRSGQVTLAAEPAARHETQEVAGLSADGRYVCATIYRRAVGGVPESLGVYRIDTATGGSVRADITSAGVPSDGTWVLGAAMSADASVVGFSDYHPAVPEDQNHRRDAYVRAGLAVAP